MASLTSLILLATSAFAIHVSYDPIYDNSTQPVTTLDCAGTLTQSNFTTFGSLPGFPNIAGGAAVTGYDSSGCGTCWALTYKNQTINVLVVDYAETGFNIAESTMNKFTNGSAVNVGVIDATSKQVNVSECGL